MSSPTKSGGPFPPLSQTASSAWMYALSAVFADGHEVSPRGKKTIEMLGYTCGLNMNEPVVAVGDRQLSYKFMAAEALWILSGSNKVADIAPYNARISEFSDDGQVFFGAYGPWVVDQLEYVVNSLVKDRDTRQAVMTMWQRNPKPSKDIPCTVALTFNIRHNLLHCHAFMRSSDIWLGLPYDVFNFSMIAAKVACCYNTIVIQNERISLGSLQVTAASSHLYESNWEDAKKTSYHSLKKTERVPDHLIYEGEWDMVEAALENCRDTTSDSGLWTIRPWI